MYVFVVPRGLQWLNPEDIAQTKVEKGFSSSSNKYAARTLGFHIALEKPLFGPDVLAQGKKFVCTGDWRGPTLSKRMQQLMQ